MTTLYNSAHHNKVPRKFQVSRGGGGGGGGGGEEYKCKLSMQFSISQETLYSGTSDHGHLPTLENRNKDNKRGHGY